MKTTFLILSLCLSLSSFAQGLAEKHQLFCDSEQVKTVKGERGSCQLLINLSPLSQKQAYCVGLVPGFAPCAVMYLADGANAGIRIYCAAEEGKPLLDQFIPATGHDYKVIGSVTKEDGIQKIVKDANSYFYFESDLVKMTVAEETVDGVMTRSASIAFIFDSSIIPLENVTCPQK